MTPRRPLSIALVATLAACASPSNGGSSGAPVDVTRQANSEAAATAVFFEFQVERPVMPGAGSCNPQYPADLREAGTRGSVHAQFIVDTAGMVEPATFKVLSSTHAGFTAAVRDAIPCMRFQPASIKGRRVRQLVQQPFTFDVASSR